MLTDNATIDTEADNGDGNPPNQAAPLQWAIVELMGHQKIAGAVSQQAFGGAQLVRVDVPAVTTTEQVWRHGGYVDVPVAIPSHTRSLGAASIYSINWCDELAATLAAHAIKHQPLRAFSLQATLQALPEPERQRLLALTAGSAITTTVTTSIEGASNDLF